MQEQHEDNIENTVVPQSKKLRNEKVNKEYKINIQLISETSLDESIADDLPEDQKIDAVISLRSIHLQWLNIRKIQNLEVFTNLNVLYLQHNKIAKIEHLECLVNLEYLALNDNLICKVEGLTQLQKLTGLNLNNNQIEDVNVNQLPKSLQLLSFKQNPVCLDANYTNDLVKHLPALQMLDDKAIGAEEKLRIIGKFPQRLIQYSQRMKHFRNKQQIKKQLEQQALKDPVYLGDGINESQTLKQIREKTRKFMHEAQESYKEVVKQQKQNYQSKIKISRKIRNFKESQISKNMSSVMETNEEHHEEN